MNHDQWEHSPCGDIEHTIFGHFHAKDSRNKDVELIHVTG
jgi:hypothetical protein